MFRELSLILGLTNRLRTIHPRNRGISRGKQSHRNTTVDDPLTFY